MQKKTIYRLASLFILVALVFGSTLMVHATMQLAPLDALAVTVNPVADAYVIASSPSSNYGTSASLRVDGSPVTRSYLRFSVSGLGGAAVQSAMLRIYANSANTSGFSVLALSNNSWAEKTITYSNAPAPGNTIATSSSVAAATWVQVDISSYIKAAGTYNLVLTTTNKTNTNLAARENTAGHAPQLVVTPAGGQATATTGTKPTNLAIHSYQDRHAGRQSHRDQYALIRQLYCGYFDQGPDPDLHRRQYQDESLLAMDLQCHLPGAMGHQHQLWAR